MKPYAGFSNQLIKERRERKFKYKIKVWIPIEIEDELPFIETIDEAKSEVDNNMMMQPENIYRIVEYDEEGIETGKAFACLRHENEQMI